MFILHRGLTNQPKTSLSQNSWGKAFRSDTPLLTYKRSVINLFVTLLLAPRVATLIVLSVCLCMFLCASVEP